MYRRLAFAAVGLAVVSVSLGQSNNLQQALKDIDVQGDWIYNDLTTGYAEAKKTGKPMLVVFR